MIIYFTLFNEYIKYIKCICSLCKTPINEKLEDKMQKMRTQSSRRYCSHLFIGIRTIRLISMLGVFFWNECSKYGVELFSPWVFFWNECIKYGVELFSPWVFFWNECITYGVELFSPWYHSAPVTAICKHSTMRFRLFGKLDPLLGLF